MKNNEKQEAIQRSEFLKHLRLIVKKSQKTTDQDQLIVIESNDMERRQNKSLVMRKLSQLDHIVEHMNNEYGGHIIPVLDSDLYFQKNLQMEKLLPLIVQYLNDLKKNKYCRQDEKFYNFILNQEVQFPKGLVYDKVLNSAAIFSRKYLSSIFTRKQRPKQESTGQYISGLKLLNETIQQYDKVRQISIIVVEEYSLYQQSLSLFAQLSSTPCQALLPKQQLIKFIKQSLLNCDKLINQARQANVRWQNLVESVKQIQSNVYKGLHEYEGALKQKKKQLKTWCQSLYVEYLDLNDYLTNKMEGLALKIGQLKRDMIDVYRGHN